LCLIENLKVNFSTGLDQTMQDNPHFHVLNDLISNYQEGAATVFKFSRYDYLNLQQEIDEHEDEIVYGQRACANESESSKIQKIGETTTNYQVYHY